MIYLYKVDSMCLRRILFGGRIMYTIGICDDEVFYREHIKKLCDQFFKNKGEECKYFEFVTGEEFLNYDTEKIHLLFLDIEMPGLNGIEVLHEVENYECIWRIVFVSCHADMVWNSFSIKTLDFARKPVSYEQIDRWLSLMIRENQEDKMIYLENSNGLMSCKAEEVFYFQADRNYTLVYMKKEKYLLS